VTRGVLLSPLDSIYSKTPTSLTGHVPGTTTASWTPYINNRSKDTRTTISSEELNPATSQDAQLPVQGAFNSLLLSREVGMSFF
jgi:hypothetical protein